MKLSKSVKIDAFNLLKDEPGVWIGSFEKSLENQGPIEDIGFSTLFHFLDSSCQSWHFQYRRKNKIIIWSELKEDFVEDMQNRFVEKLSQLKKKYVPDELVEKYVEEQCEVHKSFFPKLSEKELILAAMAGLPKEMQLELNEYKDVALSVFLNFCNYMDQAKKDEARKEQEEHYEN